MDNINLKDFKNLCRMCMSNCGIKFPQDNVISTVFYKLTNIHFDTNEELPQQICSKCFEKINEIYEFSFKCKQTHFSLLKRLYNLKNARINVDETNEPLKIEEIIIDEHKIGVVKDEIIIDELESEKHENNIFEEIMIPETSVQNINFSDDHFSETNRINIEEQVGEESDDNVNLKVETSERGKNILIVDGGKFTFSKVLKTEETFWRCYIKTCKAKVWTVGPEKLISRSELDHTHLKNTKALHRQIVSNRAKRKAEEDITEKPAKIIHSVLKNSKETMNTLTIKDMHYIRNNVYYKRKKIKPTLPTSAEKTIKI